MKNSSIDRLTACKVTGKSFDWGGREKNIQQEEAKIEKSF